MNPIRDLCTRLLLPGLALTGCAVPAADGGPSLVADSGAQVEVGGAPGAAARPAVADAPLDVEAFYKLLVAEFAGRRGELALALENYLAVARSTGDPAVAERAVRIAVYARDQERGLEAARLWADTAEPNHDARRVYGALLVRAGRVEDATEVFRALIAELAPSDPDAFGRIANMLAREQSPATSVQVMQALVADHAQDVRAQYAFAQLLGRFGELDRALEVVAKVRAIDASHEQAAVFQAQVLQRQGKKQSAIEELEGFLTDNAEAHTARLTYARLLVDAKRFEEARSEFQRLAEAVPDNTDITYALGLLLLQTNDLDRAEAQFRKLVSVHERRATAWFYIGQIQENREQPEEALESYRRVDRGEHWLNAQVRAAVLISESGEVDAARRHLHALRGNNRQESVRIYRVEAEILTRAERLEHAMEVYNDALREYPTDSGLLYARAMLAVKLDQLELVERDLRDILSREPENADALNALGYTLADRTDRYEEAYELIKRAFELQPDNHYVVDSLGWVLYRLGRHDEAIMHLRRALALKPDAEVAAHLGEVLWVAGDREGAMKVWNTALEAQPADKRLLDVLKRFGL